MRNYLKNLLSPDSKTLLHICCAPCGIGIIERLRKEHSIIGYFYNPNIQPYEEYQKRLGSSQKLAIFFNFPLAIGNYDEKEWLAAVKGLEEEPEGGKRCPVCFRFRLTETARKAKELGCEYLATTLATSPHKDFEVINRIGEEVCAINGISYLPYLEDPIDYRKRIEISKRLGLYRQKYCGCIYSQWKMVRR